MTTDLKQRLKEIEADSKRRIEMLRFREQLTTADALERMFAFLIAELRKAMAEQVRLFDLVRYQRAELHEAELITDEEYAVLCVDGATGEKRGSVNRLETYDDLKAQCQAMREVLNVCCDKRAVELAKRLVAPGEKAHHVSCSETHEISEHILGLNERARQVLGKETK